MKCDYCGEREASKVIINPNDLVSYWNVCNKCSKLISQMQESDFKKLIREVVE